MYLQQSWTGVSSETDVPSFAGSMRRDAHPSSTSKINRSVFGLRAGWRMEGLYSPPFHTGFWFIGANREPAERTCTTSLRARAGTNESRCFWRASWIALGSWKECLWDPALRGFVQFPLSFTRSAHFGSPRCRGTLSEEETSSIRVQERKRKKVRGSVTRVFNDAYQNVQYTKVLSVTECGWAFRRLPLRRPRVRERVGPSPLPPPSLDQVRAPALQFIIRLVTHATLMLREPCYVRLGLCCPAQDAAFPARDSRGSSIYWFTRT